MHTFQRILLTLGLGCLPMGVACAAVLSGQMEARLVITRACEVTASARVGVSCAASANGATRYILSTGALQKGAAGDRVIVTLTW